MSRRCGGKLFHARGPAALRLRSPKLLCIWYHLMQIVRLIMAIVCCLISAGSESSYEIQAEFHVKWSNNHWRWWHSVSMLGTSQSAVSVIQSLATCTTAETGILKMIGRKTCFLFILYPYISQKYDQWLVVKSLLLVGFSPALFLLPFVFRYLCPYSIFH